MLKLAQKLVVNTLVFVLILYVISELPSYSKISQPYFVDYPKPLEGKLSLNNKLEYSEKWLKGSLYGPESFASWNGTLYASIHGGYVVNITGNKVVPIVKLGKPCEEDFEEKICGRPLGMQFDKNGSLIVADPYYGIFKVNIQSGKKINLVSTDIEINGYKPKIPNSVAVASNGDIFWTDSSTDFLLQDGIYAVLSDGSGRLIHYNSKTKNNTVLLKNLHYPNGIVISENEEFIIFCETVQNRLIKYNIKNKTHDIFVDGLPGFPDKIRSDYKGGYLVALYVAVDKENPSLIHMIAPFTSIRKIVTGVFGLFDLGFEIINKIYSCRFAQKGMYNTGHFNSVTNILPNRATVVHISRAGKILDSVHSNNKNFKHFSEAFVFKDNLYLGSPFNDFIGRVSLHKLGWQHLKEST